MKDELGYWEKVEREMKRELNIIQERIEQLEEEYKEDCSFLGGAILLP